MAAAPGPRILLYHRVFAPASDPQLLSVSPENFRAQMEWLVSNAAVVTLGEMAGRADNSDLPQNAVAITFDDGYFDNFTEALPVLESVAAPATVFVSSGFVDSRREMWWDEVESLLLGDDDFGWDVTKPVVTRGQQQYLEICARLKFESPESRELILAGVRAKRGREAVVRASHRGLSRQELSQLAGSSQVEIGGHTVDHVALSRFSRSVQLSQVSRDKAALEAFIGKEVKSFAYPFGTETEFDAQTAAVVAEAGYSLACANVPGTVGNTNRFRIPRNLVRNWDQPAFARIVGGWLHG